MVGSFFDWGKIEGNGGNVGFIDCVSQEVELVGVQLTLQHVCHQIKWVLPGLYGIMDSLTPPFFLSYSSPLGSLG